MLPPDQAIVTTGNGPLLILVHATGANRDSFAPFLRSAGPQARMIAYDRRGTPGWPVTPEQLPASVAEHAGDLADLIEQSGETAHLFGASFGAIIVLELCRTRPELARSATLYEPPIADNSAPPLAAAFLAQFDRLISQGKPEEAAERFHRRLMGDAAWERLSAESRERARALWPHLHADLRAQRDYRVSFSELGRVTVPMLLLRGERSADVFEDTMAGLAEALPRSQRGTLKGAGHQITGPAWQALATALFDFMERR